MNIAPATANSPKPAAVIETVMQNTVLAKGGHTVAIQYAGAKNVVFGPQAWNLSVQAYPESRKRCQPNDEKHEVGNKRADRAGFRSGAIGSLEDPGEGSPQCPRSGNRAGRGSGSPRIRRAR